MAVNQLNMQKKFLALLAASLFCTALWAQSVDEVIAKYETAMGGRDKLASLQSVYMEGVSVMPNGNEITTKVTRVNKQLFRTDIDFGMGSFSLVVTNAAGWASNPRNGGKFEALPADRLQAMQAELDLSGQLSNYAAKGNKALLLGTDTANGNNCYKVQITQPAGTELVYYIDQSTGYIVREQRKGGMMGGGRPGGGSPAGGAAGDGLVNTDYADYQKTTEGYVFPMSIKRGGMGGTMMIEKIEVNQPVDPKKYKPE